MYVPDHFRPSGTDVQALLRQPGAVDLVTATARGLMATRLPMAWDEPRSRPGLGEFGALVGHVAIKNDQWREPAIGDAMAIVSGPDAYVTPSWYETKREHGRVVRLHQDTGLAVADQLGQAADTGGHDRPAHLAGLKGGQAERLPGA